MKIFRITFTIVMSLCISTTCMSSSVHLIYGSEFSTEFDLLIGEWYGVDSLSVKSTILSRVSDDFDDFSITVSESTGDIKVYIGRNTESYFGSAATGIGSLYYNANPYVEVYSNHFADQSEWQGSNATEDRIAEALAGTISHEVGHILNLYHAFMYDEYDPTGSGVRDITNFPYEPVDISQSRLSAFEANSESVYKKLMATSDTDISYNQRATIDRGFSGYSVASIISV